MSESKIKWGIIGLGNIAHQFVNDLLLVNSAEIVAVASRNKNKAVDFAKQYDVKKAYGSYDELLKDEEIDIVYIATPHNSHASLSINSLEKGKHVLCEKPIALNFSEASKMIATSKRTGKFLMEGFWSRFNPSIVDAYTKIIDGKIGDIKYINAEFAFYVESPNGTRLADLSLGGGSLLDIGVYPLFLSYLLLGVPESIIASAKFFESGADKQTSMILQYKDAQAVLHSSFVSTSSMTAHINGEKGRIQINPVWHEAQSYDLIINNEKAEFHFPTEGNGFTYEIEECHKCILNNQIESNIWSHQNSLELIKIVDEVKHQIGLIYPSDIKKE